MKAKKATSFINQCFLTKYKICSNKATRKTKEDDSARPRMLPCHVPDELVKHDLHEIPTTGAVGGSPSGLVWRRGAPPDGSRRNTIHRGRVSTKAKKPLKGSRERAPHSLAGFLASRPLRGLRSSLTSGKGMCGGLRWQEIYPQRFRQDFTPRSGEPRPGEGARRQQSGRATLVSMRSKLQHRS
ncbi:hypothetical protein Nepgr_025058 [Nepenthes gracilis]|uniref:Uncharacterized protein n=1 Tax=Nepenthes gracilis TaxID=150966 RepID=A0AAD3T548_NEPGR|nr:hypothetical protein Nepgr_025058 [Nepenthes gracilis]